MGPAQAGQGRHEAAASRFQSPVSPECNFSIASVSYIHTLARVASAPAAREQSRNRVQSRAVPLGAMVACFGAEGEAREGAADAPRSNCSNARALG